MDMNALHHLDTYLIDPADKSSSGVESFDNNDMYGSDHGMEIVSESMETEAEVEISQSLEVGAVSANLSPLMSEDLMSE
jgi:hypothetical protein